MTCPKCGSSLAADVSISGGCQGHSGEEYCYCGSPDVEIDMRCTARKCRYRTRIISDKYTLERYMTNNYKPEHSTEPTV